MTIETQLAEALAAAESSLAAKQAKHDAATEKVRDMRARIAELTERQQAISAKRVAGSGSPGDAAEFQALAGDIELLRQQLRGAEAAAGALDSDAEQSAAESARFQWQRYQDATRLEALAAKARELDSVFLRLVGEIRQAGQAVGKHRLNECWKPSRALWEVLDREFASGELR